MKIRTESDLRENLRNAEVFLIGDVRDVVYSRAERVVALPKLVHGLGVCGENDPSTLGEGIVVRGRAAKTPPDSDAGLKVDYVASSEGLYSSFLVGWNAEPSFTTQFVSESGISLNQFYQAIFMDLRERELLRDHDYVFAEMFGLFKPEDIFDRALQCPINRGHVLTTSPEHSAKFFKTKVIYSDLVQRNASLDRLIPLCVVGMAYLCENSVQTADGLNERVFYAPPLSANPPSSDALDEHSGPRVLSHNHALGWRRERFHENHTDESLHEDELLDSHPDYLIHLDDWSTVRSATVKIYLAEKDRFTLS
jgi:hypothetical protein